MKVKFANGVVKTCTAPTEQKIFKIVSEKDSSWLLNFRLTENVTSSEMDLLVTNDNIETLEFTDDSGNMLFMLSGYEKVTSAIIRHSDSADTASVEIQLSK